MNKPKMLQLVAVAALAVAPFASASDEVQTVEMSTDAYNRLVFPEPYSQIVIPPEAELRDNPVPTDGKRGLLMRPADEADPFSVFVQLRSGEAFTVRVQPKSGIDAQVFRYRNATDLSREPEQERRPQDRWIADTILSAFQGQRPNGFEPAGAPPSARLTMPNGGTMRLTAEAQYRGSGHVVNVYRLSSDVAVEVEPRDFYRQGVVAISLEGDTVSEGERPRMIVVEVDRG